VSVIMVSIFCSPIHIVIIFNGLIKRNVEVKVKNLNLKLA